MQRSLAAVALAWMLAGAIGCRRSHVLFEDFTYATTAELARHGWILRTAPGSPGVRGTSWGPESFALHDDPSFTGNRVLRMTSVTDGTSGRTRQAQICHQRKYLEGTYAARVRFTDEPTVGTDGDPIVETFYFISPLEAPMDLEYSELDFEYLPNGGWGHSEPSLRGTTWETFQEEPMIYDNITGKMAGPLAGWHTLVAQVAAGRVRYFVDAKPLADHGDKFYPEVPMSINFNLWFIEEGLLPSPEIRQYEQDIDWVLFRRDEVLSPKEVEAAVAELRRERVQFRDTVPRSGLASPCDF
ncbi:MAG TPA: glycoside hydrolase family 16 protein [Polyangiaceae bacterium]|nr:glycoside hydrolase family 16 protein [Polyangiaceae bacterium]